MAKQQKSIIEIMKERIKGAGRSKKDLFYLKPDTKKRVRFLNDMEEAVRIVFHDKWGEVNTPCLKQYDQECPYCDRTDVKTRDHFAWSVYCYDDKAVQIFMFKANENTPVPALIAMYEAYGTIRDRDYVIARTGERFDTTYSVVPMDKAEFKKKKSVKPLSEDEILEKVRAAFASDLEDEDLDDEDIDDDSDDVDEDEELDDEDEEDEDEDEDDDDDEEEDDDDEDEEEDKLMLKKKNKVHNKHNKKHKKTRK